MNLLVTNTRNAQAYAIIRALRLHADKIVAMVHGWRIELRRVFARGELPVNGHALLCAVPGRGPEGWQGTIG